MDEVSQLKVPLWPAVETILNAGLVAAAIDALYFSTSALLSGHSPLVVLQRIAGFWLGGRSTDLGLPSTLLGAATHIGLATAMAAGFALAVSRFRLRRDRAVALGAGYGLSLYALMYFAVMPLRWPALFPNWMGWRSAGDIVVHVIVGIAIALMLRSRWPADQGRAPIAS